MRSLKHLTGREDKYKYLRFCQRSRGVPIANRLLSRPFTSSHMRNLLEIQLVELGIKGDIEVEFIYTPPYSPDFNLVEYLIHQLRLQLLHHQPVDTTIELIRAKLEQYFQVNQLQTPQQIHAYNCSYLFPSQITW